MKIIRQQTSDAGGLVIAPPISHAVIICHLLIKIAGETPILVTSIEQKGHDKLRQYTNGKQPWLVSIGMVSEGNDILCLQVCCHLGRIRTELHFR